jgi:transcriptional antiterminator NusG
MDDQRAGEGEDRVEVLDAEIEVVAVTDGDGEVVAEAVEVTEVLEVTHPDGSTSIDVVDVVEVVDESGEIVAEDVEVIELEVDDEGAAAEDADSEDTDGEGEPEERAESPFDRPGRWFVVHTYSGYENKVKGNLENIIKARELGDRIHEIVVPMEDVVEFKNGKKVTVSKKVFPGYLLVRCTPSDDVWFAIRSSPGVTGFVGSASKPTPLSRREVESILHVKVEGVEAPTKRSRPAHEFELNETVRIKEGPFADFPGHIAEINEDQLKLKVLVDIFGRETPVELEFSQVAKL